MNIVLYDESKNLKFEKIETDKEINLKESVDYLYDKEINNNHFLKFMDFLLEKVDINQENKIYYYGESKRIWSYLLLFSYISENIKLFYKTEEVKGNNILKLNLKNIGFKSGDLKKEVFAEKFEEFPDYIKNLYHKKEGRFILSKIGEVYAKNIEN